MRIILLVMVIFSTSAQADTVDNTAQLGLLPHYCWGTQQIREISKDPVPIDQYEATYGESYHHFHHYCWALNAENIADRMTNEYLKKSKLAYALGDYKYFLDRATPDFPFLPDVYTSRARVFFKLKRNAEAVSDLRKAIELKPGYAAAYSQLSEYYQRTGDRKDAIKTLEDGLSNNRDPGITAYFIGRLKDLGSIYKGTPGSALPKEAEPGLGNKPEDQAEATNSAADKPSSSDEQTKMPEANSSASSVPKKNTPADKPAQSNPYCRFCP